MANSTSPTLIDIDPLSCLGSDDIVQSDHPAVVELANELRASTSTLEAFAEAAFVWVRDNVGHSFDVSDSRVTLTASEVLEQRVGLCYAKSHLLAALLRSQSVPTALCYQLLHDADTGGLALHGLVAIYMCDAWHRQDPRGSKEGVDAQFSLDDEQLAWHVDTTIGERDDPLLYAVTDPVVIAALRSTDNILDLYALGLPAALPSERWCGSNATHRRDQSRMLWTTPILNCGPRSSSAWTTTPRA